MRAAATWQQAVTRQFSADPREVSRARRLARETLTGWNLTAHADLAQLVTSELVTNAIRHGTGPVQVTLSRTAAELRIDVHDDGPGRPECQHASAADEGGRGLDLIDALIALQGGSWSVRPDTAIPDGDGPGKTVQVTFPVPDTLA
jgi:two-component sensor histidine kinase